MPTTTITLTEGAERYVLRVSYEYYATGDVPGTTAHVSEVEILRVESCVHWSEYFNCWSVVTADGLEDESFNPEGEAVLWGRLDPACAIEIEERLKSLPAVMERIEAECFRRHDGEAEQNRVNRIVTRAR